MWFDVEKRYKTIYSVVDVVGDLLWFDVEKRYKTMAFDRLTHAYGCGLM